MSAKIVAINQTRSESELDSKDRIVAVSVIDVESDLVPPPPSYEQAIITQSEIERQRIQEQQRALEQLAQNNNRFDRNRIEEQLVQQQPQVHQQPQIESIAQISSTPNNTRHHQIVQHVYAAAPQVGPSPSNLTCPSCHAAIKTRVEYVTTTRTHLSALLCCAVCWPCALCPYLIKDCRDALHYCPSCGAYIGAHAP